MNTIFLERPPVEAQEADGDEHRYVVVAENRLIAFVCILFLHARDEQECRELTVRWFLSTDHGIPTAWTIVPVSADITTFNIASNDEDVCAFLDIDPLDEEEGGRAP